MTLFAQRSYQDSQADNFALRAAALATPELAERMAQQARTDPDAFPTGGTGVVTINGVEKMPRGATARRVPARVTYTVEVTANGQVVNRLTAAALNVVVVQQDDGMWLVDNVADPAN